MLNQPQIFARECVFHHAKCDKSDEFYSLEANDLPDFVQSEFAAILMSDDNEWAVEATGPDNKHWETKMLPALIKFLKNSTDQDEALEFNNIWRECVTDYMNK